MKIYDVIKALLVARGWRIDHEAVRRPDGELHEFIHPSTGKRMNYIEAICAEESREEEPGGWQRMSSP